MERSDTTTQLGENKPITSMTFEVVRRAEFVFEPFLGSLIQLPAARMQRSQSSEFFLAQPGSRTARSSLDALRDEKLVWERPQSQPRASTRAIPDLAEKLKALPVEKHREKHDKTAKDLEAPRFYQPQTVRFFDPVAASAEEGDEAALEQPGSRPSIQLSPELKAAILRIDEQRLQLQQEEKPGKGKKRGLLKGRAARTEDAREIPVEIVKSRDVALTERAVRWEEILPPQSTANDDAVAGEMAATSTVVKIEPAEEVMSVAADEAVALRPRTSVESMASPLSEAVPTSEMVPVLEAVLTSEVESTAEITSAEETVSAQYAIPIDETASPSLAEPLPEIFTKHALEPMDENDEILTWESASTEEALHAPDADWETPFQALPAIAAPLVESVMKFAEVSEPANGPVEDDALIPMMFEADSSAMTQEEEDQQTTAKELAPSERLKAMTAAISRVRREDLVVEPVETEVSEIRNEESPRKPRSKKEKLPIGQRLQRWFGGEEPKLDGNRRRAERVIMPGLVAFYWSGGVPEPHEIVNISKTGFYLKTTELWSLETLVRMTLQRPSSETKRKGESISVLARVVRIDEGGVGHEFVTTEALEHARSRDVMPSHGTDWRQLDRFLHMQ